MALFKSKQDTLADNLYDEQVHGAVASEIAAGNVVAGLWAKAFAQADGDEKRAKAIYIKLRVEQIKLGNAAQAEQAREAEKLCASVTAPHLTQEQRMQQQEQQVKQGFLGAPKTQLGRKLLGDKPPLPQTRAGRIVLLLFLAAMLVSAYVRG